MFDRFFRLKPEPINPDSLQIGLARSVLSRFYTCITLEHVAIYYACVRMECVARVTIPEERLHFNCQRFCVSKHRVAGATISTT